MNIAGFLVKEIIVFPRSYVDLQETISKALLYALEHHVDVIVRYEEKDYHILPEGIIRDVCNQHKEEGGD